MTPPHDACRFCDAPAQPSENRCCGECREALGARAPRRLPAAPAPMKGRVAGFVRAAALALLLFPAACTNRNGSTDWGETLLLGAGVGTAAAVLGGVFNDVGNSQREPRHGRYGYGRSYGHGSGHGYGGYRPGGYSGYLGSGSYGSGYSPAYRY